MKFYHLTRFVNAKSQWQALSMATLRKPGQIFDERVVRGLSIGRVLDGDISAPIGWAKSPDYLALSQCL
jgi:hypothetical protein